MVATMPPESQAQLTITTIVGGAIRVMKSTAAKLSEWMHECKAQDTMPKHPKRLAESSAASPGAARDGGSNVSERNEPCGCGPYVADPHYGLARTTRS